jgi:transposase
MAMGKRRQRQEALFVMSDGLPKSAGHPFYQRLNAVLAEANFDHWIEKRCQRYYEQEEQRGQPSIPPGVYFRMLLVGYFEGIDSQRGIAWPTLTGARRTASACGNSWAFRSTK